MMIYIYKKKLEFFVIPQDIRLFYAKYFFFFLIHEYRYGWELLVYLNPGIKKNKMRERHEL